VAHFSINVEKHKYQVIIIFYLGMTRTS